MDLKSFKNRLADGKIGELCFQRALDKQVIKNLGWRHGPKVTEPLRGADRDKQIWDNKVDGDVIFTATWDGREKYVDVKVGTWVSEESLKHFRLDDSYYCFNAWTYDRNMHFLVRADQEFRDWALGLPVVMSGKTPGRYIDFTKLPSSYHCGNHGLVEFEPNDFNKIIIEVEEYLIENNIPYKKRIAR